MFINLTYFSILFNRDFKIQRRGRDESRPEVKIPKMTTTAHDRDVNKPRPCSRRTRWRPFWRCWQTVSIWTYFDCELAIFVCISKLNYPGYIPHVFVVVVSLQARKNVEFQTAVSRFLHSSFSELRLKKQNDLLYKSNVVPDYFLLVEDFPSIFFFLLTEIFITTTSLTKLSLQNLRLQKITIKN